MEDVKKDIKEEKQKLREQHIDVMKNISSEKLDDLNRNIEYQLLDFANFLEARIVLLYVNYDYSVPLENIITKSLENEKIIALPVCNEKIKSFTIYKIDDYEKDLIKQDDGKLVPNKERCKILPIDSLDIVIVPGMMFDEKGGRLGSGKRTYDRLIPKLPNTVRKVALAYESQIIPSVPMASHDKYVDIIISENKIIYKI